MITDITERTQKDTGQGYTEIISDKGYGVSFSKKK